MPKNSNTYPKPQCVQTDVSKSAFDKLNLNMNKNWAKYISSKGSLEAYLSDFIDFDFSINDMPGDGFVVLDYQNDKVASVESCFKIILEKGKINQEDFAILSF
jgi:hypothetical protein